MPDRCAYTATKAGGCKRLGTSVVAGVEGLLCKQHARIVATEPGQSGVIRHAPVGVDGIVTELGLATTTADLERCRSAIAQQIDVCMDQSRGLNPRLSDALSAARQRVRAGAGR